MWPWRIGCSADLEGFRHGVKGPEAPIWGDESHCFCGLMVGFFGFHLQCLALPLVRGGPIEEVGLLLVCFNKLRSLLGVHCFKRDERSKLLGRVRESKEESDAEDQEWAPKGNMICQCSLYNLRFVAKKYPCFF